MFVVSDVAGMLWTVVGFVVVLASDLFLEKTKLHLKQTPFLLRRGFSIAGCTQRVSQKKSTGFRRHFLRLIVAERIQTFIRDNVEPLETFLCFY